MDYHLLLLPVAGFIWWKRYQIIDRCFGVYAKVQITWDSYFPKSTSHDLVSIYYFDHDHTHTHIDLTNEFAHDLEYNKTLVWDTIFASVGSVHPEARLQVVYKIADQQYRCTFSYKDNESYPIKFPLYEEEEIIRHKTSAKFKNGILSATVGDKEVTDLVQEYHGPLQDFHDGIGSKVKPRWVNNSESELEVIDSMANIHSIKHTDTHIKIRED